MKGKSKMRKYQDWTLDSEDENVYGTSYMSSASIEISAPHIAAPAPKPRSGVQERYQALLESPTPIIISTGAAGTGKTYLPCAIGIRKLLAGQIDRLVITRPMVGVDEIMGALPGDVISKSEPWLKPITQVFALYAPQQKINKMIEQDIIEIAPLAMMRGRTFDNAWIIADEFQNSTVAQMKMLLTRIGANSKMIITGDLSQEDLVLPYGQINGLQDLFNRMKSAKGLDNDIGLIEFGIEDVCRHPIIKKILNLYAGAAAPPRA